MFMLLGAVMAALVYTGSLSKLELSKSTKLGGCDQLSIVAVYCDAFKAELNIRQPDIL